MADETREKTPAALKQFKVKSLRPIDEQHPNREDGSLRPAIATVEVEVLVTGSKDIEFLNGAGFDSAKDMASGFFRLQPQAEHPEYMNLVAGGIRKWEPRTAQA